MSWRLLIEAVTSRVSPAAAEWLEGALARTGGEGDPEAFGRSWSGAGRRLGRAPLEFSQADAAALGRVGAPFVPVGWGADEAGRALLLLAALERVPADRQPGFVEELFRTGEVRERQALARTLGYLPGPERFVDVATEAVRGNMLSVVEAMGIDNPFPAAHVPDPLFNQMIMKLLFNGLPLGRVEGLDRRRNAELARIAASWVDERRAAGRPVPDDVSLILAR